MATLQNDIPVATVDAARRGDEILPEHEANWPATDFVCDTIKARYDGTSSTSHEIGLSLTTIKHGAYPGWRIEQIAKQIGVHEPRRRDVIERSRTQDDGERKRLQRSAGMPGAPLTGEKPSKPRVQLINADNTDKPICEQCNLAFEPWRKMRGVAYPTKLCRECFSDKMKVRLNQGTATEPEAEPEATTPPISKWLDLGYEVTPGTAVAPTLSAFSAPVVEIEDDEPESFGDLPGSDIVFALLDRLPVSGRWSGRERYRWLTAFTAALDLLIDDDRDEEVAR